MKRFNKFIFPVDQPNFKSKACTKNLLLISESLQKNLYINHYIY